MDPYFKNGIWRNLHSSTLWSPHVHSCLQRAGNGQKQGIKEHIFDAPGYVEALKSLDSRASSARWLNILCAQRDLALHCWSWDLSQLSWLPGGNLPPRPAFTGSVRQFLLPALSPQLNKHCRRCLGEVLWLSRRLEEQGGSRWEGKLLTPRPWGPPEPHRKSLCPSPACPGTVRFSPGGAGREGCLHFFCWSQRSETRFHQWLITCCADQRDKTILDWFAGAVF